MLIEDVAYLVIGFILGIMVGIAIVVQRAAARVRNFGSPQPRGPDGRFVRRW